MALQSCDIFHINNLKSEDCDLSVIQRSLDHQNFWRNNSCCGSEGPSRLFLNNCCCISFFNLADNNTSQQRTETFTAVCFLYGVAIIYLLHDVYISFQSKKQKTLWDFIKSRKLVLLCVSIFSMTVGLGCSYTHYATFRCAGGSINAGPNCPGGFQNGSDAQRRLQNFFAMDAVSNISFIISKVLILQNILHTVQIGLEQSPHAPNIRVLKFAVVCLYVPCLFFFIAAMTARAFNDTNNWYVIQFAASFVTFIFAMISAVLYVQHTSFHLNRYLDSLKSTLPRDDDAHEVGDAELSTFDRIKMFARNSPTGKFIKNLSGSLRRLQIAVVLIFLSFSIKFVLYVMLVRYFSSSLNSPTKLDFSDPIICNSSAWGKRDLVIGRSMLGSPLLIPVLTMFADPILMMISKWLTSGSKNKQSAEAKINIGMARVVNRQRGSFVDFFSKNPSDLLPSPSSSPQTHDNMLL